MSTRARTKTITLFAAGSVALAVAVASRGRDAGERAVPRAFAERGDLAVTLVEPGTLEAARSVTIASEIRSNRAKIVALAGDGTWVRAGDAVVSFDRTPFEEERTKALGELRDAEAAALRAAEERKLAVAKADEALQAARHAEKIARLNLESFEKGNGALTVREAEVRAAESGSELGRAEADLRDLEEMFRRGFVSEGELARARGKVTDLGRQSGLASDRLRATREVLVPRDLERARAELAEARDAAARAEAVGYHTREYYQAAVVAAERKVETARAALAAAEQELEKTEVRSPLDGFFLLQEIPLDAGRRKPQVGDSVWSGQAIATIPDLSQMVALTRVREVDLHRIRPGLRARLELEAYPDVRIDGRIDFVGSLAERGDEGAWKFFGVRLLLDSVDPRLRPGMSARVVFQLDTVRNAVVAPLDAIFPCGDSTCCWVRRGDETWEQPVVLGLRNETHVEVKRGLEPGAILLLAAPEGPVRRREPPPPAA